MKLKGKYSVTLLRDGKIIRKEEGHNLITDEGANAALATLFVNGTQTDIWYVRLIQSGGMAASTDTAAQHSNWYEETHYTGDVEWVPNAPSGKTMYSGTQSSFTFTDDISLYGFFIASATKGTSSGIIWAMVQFASNLDAKTGDTIKIEYGVDITT